MDTYRTVNLCTYSNSGAGSNLGSIVKQPLCHPDQVVMFSPERCSLFLCLHAFCPDILVSFHLPNTQWY